MTLEAPHRRLLVASNRLPVVLRHEAGRAWHVLPGSGGLVTALSPVLRQRGGVWVGWPGVGGEDARGVARVLEGVNRSGAYQLEAVLLTAAERRDYYEGCSNEVLWPLFHDLAWQVHVEPTYWTAFQAVNLKYARALLRHAAEPDSFIWVHDYQLLLVGRALRELGLTSRVGFFLHIPFPPVDVYLKLPWRKPVLEAMLDFDLIGFQTERDLRNFVQSLAEVVPSARVSGRPRENRVRFRGRSTRLGVFPIGIDAREFADETKRPESLELVRVHRQNMPGQTVLMGLDRLDYTKGIPRRLCAFRRFLETHPEYRGKVTLVQVVVPSRVDVRKYKDLKRDIEGLVSTLNGQFTQPGWVPVHYMYRSLSRAELAALYRTADVALVTPLKDGMNLVCKEFCACNAGVDAVLILSEFAGAAEQLRNGALLVNPYDIEGVAEAIHRAVSMPRAEQRRRMRRLRDNVFSYDVYWWVDAFLAAAYEGVAGADLAVGIA